jgi:hypothetical protein
VNTLHTLPNIIDYQTLKGALVSYKSKRDKISHLIKTGEIVRIKKGLYVLNESYRRGNLSLEHLSNLLYGPSYVSLEYALSYYGFIPEKVETITAVTTGRSREFETPFGVFTYRNIALAPFASGMEIIEFQPDIRFMMASPEKALADFLQSQKGVPIYSVKEYKKYLLSDIRLDEGLLSNLNLDELQSFAASYKSQKLSKLCQIINQTKQGD